MRRLTESADLAQQAKLLCSCVVTEYCEKLKHVMTHVCDEMRNWQHEQVQLLQKEAMKLELQAIEKRCAATYGASTVEMGQSGVGACAEFVAATATVVRAHFPPDTEAAAGSGTLAHPVNS